jgi:putative ABC transport system substrate-binding protein
MSATSTIPIAAGLADVAVTQVTNLARPGGNLTGVSPYVESEFEGKRLALLKEAVPSVSRVAAISMQTEGYDVWRSKLREYAGKLGISLIDVVLRDATPLEIERGFAELAQHRPDAMLLSPEVAFIGQARLILRLADENRLPAMYPYAVYTEFGGLMTYTMDPGELGRQLAEDVHRLLHGAKPGDIPIYQATRFRLTINLKTATALGLTVPQALLARADEVIE